MSEKSYEQQIENLRKEIAARDRIILDLRNDLYEEQNKRSEQLKELLTARDKKHK